MKIFVTGASGFIGSRFIEQLVPVLKDGDEVLCLARQPLKILNPRITQLQGSLQDLAKFTDRILACDYVFHIAAEARFGSTLDYQGQNVEPTRTLVDILKKSTVLKNFIFLSTIGALDRAPEDNCAEPLTNDSKPSPISAYGKSKLESEGYIRANLNKYTIIRPTWVYGANMRTDSHVRALGHMLTAKPWLAKIHFPGQVSLVHVNELAQALVNSLNNETIQRKTYLAVTDSRSIGVLLKELSGKMYGKSSSQFPLPRFAFIFAALHKFLPLSLVNLFLNYLWAKDDHFKKDFHLKDSSLFDQGISEIAKDIMAAPSKRYVVTGANSGIGLEIARQLRAKGYTVCCLDRQTDQLKTDNFSDVFQVDLSSNEQIDQFLAQYEKSIDGLINNAGVGFKGDFADQSWVQVDQMINVNIRGTLYLTHKLLPRLRRSKGKLVNILSSTALFPLPHMNLYAASKALLLFWSEGLAVEEKDIKVISICPSGTRTGFQKQAGVKQTSDLATPESVAGEIIKAIENNKAFILFGAKSKILVCMMKFLPWRSKAKLAGKLFSTQR